MLDELADACALLGWGKWIGRTLWGWAEFTDPVNRTVVTVKISASTLRRWLGILDWQKVMPTNCIFLPDLLKIIMNRLDRFSFLGLKCHQTFVRITRRF